MAELTPTERLQPSLLDRLTDDEPAKQQESRAARVLSPAQLRRSVLRDLAWLFNSTHFAALEPLVADHPQVGTSVLNYGMPDFAGRSTSGIDVPALERELKRVILDFEPRLLPESVRVWLTVDDDLLTPNAMVFAIEAMLWSQPTPHRLFLRTSIDLESGAVEVAEHQG